MKRMFFWIIIAAMALVTVGILASSLRRRASGAEPAAAYDLRVYRDQLAEVDRDLARGVLDPQDGERARTEIARRILTADAALHSAGAYGGSDRGSGIWLAVIAVIVVVGSGVLYVMLGAPGYGDLALKDRIAAAENLRQNRPDQATAEAGIPPGQLPRPGAPGTEYTDLVERLRTVVAERPDDLRGLRLLAASERALGNYSAAHQAFSRYVALRGTEATAEEFADLADMMILAAGGYVSPEAEAALAEALSRDQDNGPAQYYWGLMHAQTGRPDRAFRIWDALLRQGPADAPWIPPIEAQITELARHAGVANYTPPTTTATTRGPTSEDVEAAGAMSSAERMQMIEGMVGGLSERLANEGGTAAEWAQLITALGVLGRAADARSVYDNALEEFAGQPDALDIVNRAGERAGVTN